MKSRRNRESKWGAQFQPLDLDRVRIGVKRIETKRGVEYSVQTTTGQNAEQDKSWVCPHCNLAISKGQNHTVAWDSDRGVDTRRHFHNSCWKAFQGPLL
jgi:Ribonuclease G/E